MSGLSIYPTYLGQSKSNGSNTLMPSNKLKKSFFSYEMIEKNTIYFSMLFDHTPVNIMVSVSRVLVLTIIFCQGGSAIILKS
jgi:hypothetical protein